MGLGGIACVIFGQWMLLIGRDQPAGGLIFLVLGAVWVVAASWRLGLDSGRLPAVAAPAEPMAAEPPAAAGAWEAFSTRWPLGLVGLILSCLTFWAMAHNTVTVPGFCLWVASLAVWVVAFWDSRQWHWPNWVAWGERLRRPAWHLSVTRTQALLAGILLISAAFRFAQINEVPPEMTSDHVEKLLDVNAILFKGVRPIFEPTNAGREVLMFYLSAFAAWALGTGLTHLTRT